MIDPDIQDLSSGTAPVANMESELVRVTGGTVTALAGDNLTVTYGTATGVALRVADPSPFCVGATFDVVAPVTDWDGAWRIESFRAADFTRVDNTACAGGGHTPAPGDLVLNEFLADPPPLAAGDANCDTVRDGASSEDEFVEIVNVSSNRLAMSGVTISDSTGVRHTFSAATSLDPGKVVVVFGGGTPSCTWASDVQAFAASSGALGLNNGGDTITIALGAGSSATILQQYTYGAEGGHNVSLTLNPDLNDTDPTPAGVAGFVAHTVANAALAFSPGTKVDGTAF